MRFTKMHGLGNDFILVDDREGAYEGGAAQARALCNRRTGIGADGVALLRRSAVADVCMFLYNSDGSVAEMCGNALRCIAKYAYERGAVEGASFAVETPAGIKRVEITARGGEAALICADMGQPCFAPEKVPVRWEGEMLMARISALGREFLCTAVNTGVPHAVIFERGLCEEDICRYGAALERHELFPSGVNVDFAEITPAGGIALRTYERGCGRTLACGTGCCAAAVAAARAGLAGRRVTVELQLGALDVEWRQDGRMTMTGPAQQVFEGEI